MAEVIVHTVSSTIYSPESPGTSVLIQSAGAREYLIEPGPQGPAGPAGPAGPQGPQGPAGVGSAYVHSQGIASATWVIVHNLGVYPNVTVVDSSGSSVEGDISYDSISQITLTFSAPFSGTAYLS